MKILGYEIKITKSEQPKEIETPKVDVEQQAYIKLNNLYLKIEKRGWITLRDRLELENLLAEAYPVKEEMMRGWWFSEFQKLNGWLEV